MCFITESSDASGEVNYIIQRFPYNLAGIFVSLVNMSLVYINVICGWQ
jgi:hypothetical protein